MVKAFADPVKIIKNKTIFRKGGCAWTEEKSGAALHRDSKEKEIYWCLLEEYDLF